MGIPSRRTTPRREREPPDHIDGQVTTARHSVVPPVEFLMDRGEADR